MANEATPYWDPGDTLTGHAEVAVTGKRFTAISGPTVEGNPQVSPAGAGVKTFGIATRDKAAGAKVMLARRGVWPVTAGGAITAGQEVTPDAQGRAVPVTAGDRAAGLACDDAANGADCPIDLYL